MEGQENARLRALPSVDRVIQALSDRGASEAAAAARRAVELARSRILSGETVDLNSVVAAARDVLAEQDRTRLQRVINATGVVIHTNLGRVPLSERQLTGALEIAAGYSNLEYDLTTGSRGSRHDHCRSLLTAATGAEDALIVNNNAAAVLVTLAALCARREAIVSRGELIEIGGEFRLPDVMTAAGVHLVEVGTTNRTHLADYERAITDSTAAVVKVHPANYRISGFTASVTVPDLVRLARTRGLPLIYDLGSGLISPSALPAEDEPDVRTVIDQGVDVATFSGDKLLGSAQAGIIVGRAELLQRISKHPLMRAVRVDKMTLAVLQSTLSVYLEGREQELPLWQMLGAPADQLQQRAEAVASAVEASLGSAGIKVEVDRTESVAGGGSLPGTTMTSWGIRIEHPEVAADQIAHRLRRGRLPVIARIESNRVLIDLRTVAPAQDADLQEALVAVLV